MAKTCKMVRVLAALALVCVLQSQGQSGIVADEDFEGGATGWSINTTDEDTTNTPNDFTEFLGRFGGASGAQTVYKTYTLPGLENGVQVQFDFYQLDSWDTENFVIYIDDVVVATDTYAHGTLESPPNAVALDASLANRVFYSWSDERYRYTFLVPATGSTVKVGFGSTLNSGLTDESWGIDNVLISEVPYLETNTWDFGTADLQGWQVLNGDAYFRTGDGDGMTPANSSGGFAHDGDHDTLLVQSPMIHFTGGTFDGTNALIVQFAGGAGDQDGDGVIFNSPADVLAFNGGNSNSDGQKGLAFLNVYTGLYEATIFEPTNGGTDTWYFTLSDLVALGIDPTHVYRIQYFENDESSWGWGQLNLIRVAAEQVPEPSSLAMLLGLGAVGLLGWMRRRRRS